MRLSCSWIFVAPSLSISPPKQRNLFGLIRRTRLEAPGRALINVSRELHQLAFSESRMPFDDHIRLWGFVQWIRYILTSVDVDTSIENSDGKNQSINFDQSDCEIIERKL